MWGGKVTPQSSLVRRWFLMSDVNVFLYSSLKPFVFSDSGQRRQMEEPEASSRITKSPVAFDFVFPTTLTWMTEKLHQHLLPHVCCLSHKMQPGLFYGFLPTTLP
ncbi:hypothetical protein ATANTOWER_016044 [Ataeniobius toweri]|uniref:Uncharacterized protein n=1 Tax=Ataeniobius toweri TaxID=208326 RepID=A0ABU7BQJ7_9TELE|nr:hypothetical protein [Ataeniobius toweri]